MSRISETITENIFRTFYGSEVFIEKSAIPSWYGFKSKKGTTYSGYPDFFLDTTQFAIIVEAKADDILLAEKEVKFYMENNSISKDIIGIAISGQKSTDLKVTYFFKSQTKKDFKTIEIKDTLVPLNDLIKAAKKAKYGEMISTESLISVLKDLNKKFNDNNRIRDTNRSLFFSGIMIALTNYNFRSTYLSIQAPTKEEISSIKTTVLEAHHLNNAILAAIDCQLKSKINNMSKEFSWKDQFSFIKNIDYSLIEYKNIISIVENKIFLPFENDEKQDILGRAYKIFLSRAGSVDNKNIILTPDHIKSLMVKLARLNVDDVVLDTCTGSGGFLMESMETMIKMANGNIDKIEEIKLKQLIGFEIDPVLFSLACSNMFLHGDGRSNLLYRSSLLNSNTTSSIVNNKDAELFKYIRSFHPKKVIINPPYENNSSIAFVLQALDYLDADGKLIIIMPTPTLTHNQGGLTEKVLSKAKLDFVIKMPMNLFSEQKRTVNTSIFGFTKTPHKKTDETIFYNLKDDGFISIQHKGRIDKNGTWNKIEEDILDCILNSKEKAEFCVKKRIYNNDVLNCAGFLTKRNSKYELVKVSTLFNIDDGTLASSEADENGEYDFITASEEWKKHSTYVRNDESLVMAVSAGGSLGRTHYVNGKYIVSNLCIILTEKNPKKYPINLEFYNHYFAGIREQLVDDLADGTSKLTISKPSLKEYYIDYVPIDVQNAFVNNFVLEYKRLLSEVKKAKEKVNLDIKKIIK